MGSNGPRPICSAMNKNKDKFIVTFAGPIGSSKTPIAHYLSCDFNLPIYNNDVVRTEVMEDLLFFDKEEHKKRRDSRIKEILNSGNSFILDASVDREWKNYIDDINKSSYEVFIIGLDLSKEFLLKLYKVKQYNEVMKQVDKLLDDHNNFLKEFGDNVNLHITDQNFSERLKLSSKKLKEWLKQF